MFASDIVAVHFLLLPSEVVASLPIMSDSEIPYPEIFTVLTPGDVRRFVIHVGFLFSAQSSRGDCSPREGVLIADMAGLWSVLGL